MRREMNKIMKTNRFWVSSLVLLIIVSSCRDPIDLKFEAEDPKVVIDGFITDQFRPQTVRLSYSSGFTEEGFFEPNPIENALVRIEDDQGESFDLTHQGNGLYESTSFFAEEGKSYRVVVNLESEEYASTFEQLPAEAPQNATLSYQAEEKEELSGNGLIVSDDGVGVYANIAKSDQTVYYQWLIQEWFIAEAFFSPGIFCYVKDFDVPRVVVLEDQARQEGEGDSYDFRLGFVPVSVKTKRDFAFVANQLILTQEAFEYWNDIKEQSQTVGSLFDSAPFTIIGNVFNTNTDEAALGYFGVYRESIGRTFFSEAELPYPITDYPCNPPPVVPNICTDCSLWAGEINLGFKPNWWR